MARTYLIAGNWKMHGTLKSTQALARDIKSSTSPLTAIEILLLPTFIHLAPVKAAFSHTNIQLGAQNLYTTESGAFTGEISGVMLKDAGCEYVLIGHSERRTIFKEDLTVLAQKFQAAVQAGLKPILCVGETKTERERGETETVLQKQIQSVIDHSGISAFKDAVIAYEPVWAIGTGLTATPEMAQTAHAFIRSLIAENNIDLSQAMRILYGGSMKADNAASLLAMPDIDGGLIGGASLDANSFTAICQAANQLANTK